jgi:PKD repeat protein
MKILSKLKRTTARVLTLAVVATAFVGVAMANKPADAATAANNSDCGNAVYCGGVSSASDAKTKYDGTTKASKDMKNVYDSSTFNISQSDMDSLGASAENGTVTRSGDVYVGSTLVATGATTAGLENISGSTKHTNNGTTFYSRAPSVSFLQSSLPAIVDMKDGVFQFALINSCANPVTAKPKTPNYAITKQVSIAGQGDYKNELDHVKAGTKVDYKITVSSTGAIADKNITVKDNLPPNINEVANSLTRNDPGSNNTVNGDDKAFFSTGVNIASLSPGQSVTFKFEATVGTYKDTDPQCKAQTLTNTGTINSAALSPKSASAIVKTYCTPPVYSCTNLQDVASPDDPLTFGFVAQAKAQNGANNTSFTFDFGDGSSKTVDSNASNMAKTMHTYAKGGTYNVRVTATFKVNGKTVTDTGKNCTVTVKPKSPPAPVYSCTNLTDSKDSDNTYTFNASSSAKNGAALIGYTYNFGDGSSSAAKQGDSIKHTYTTPGTYTASVTASFTVNGKTVTDTGANCQVTVKIPTPPVQTLVCDKLTAVSDSRTMYTFNASASATKGATITGYTFDFGDTSSKTVTTAATTASANHTYTAPGTYTATVNVLGTINGKATTVTSYSCDTTVTVAPQPTAECDGLVLDQDATNPLSYTATATYTTTGAATLTGASINWGDGTSSDTAKGGPGVAEFDTHTYATSGNYTAIATLTFSGANQSSSTCQAVVTPNVPQAVYTCDAFTATVGDNNRTITVASFNTTATNGAVFTGADINWGDNSAVTSTATPVGQTHVYAADGTYTVEAVAHFNVNGQDVTAGGANCQTTVTISTQTCTSTQTGTYPNCVTPTCTTGQTGTYPTCTTPTTPAPTVLVNTGAGNVIGLFAGVSIVGTLGYRWFLSRKLSNS